MPALLVAAGLLVRYDVFGWGDVAMRYGRPYMIFWLFALGWLAQRAQTTWQRVAISVVLAVTLTGYFPDEPVRGLVVQVGLLMLIWLPTACCTAANRPGVAWSSRGIAVDLPHPLGRLAFLARQAGAAATPCRRGLPAGGDDRLAR